MTRMKISQSTLNDLQGTYQPQSSSNTGGGDGSLQNPYSWEEYINLSDEEVISSPCYYVNYSGVTSYSLATVIVDALYNNTEYENTAEKNLWIDSFMEDASSFFNTVYSYMEEGYNSVTNNPFSQALTRYNSGTGTTLTLDINELGFDGLTMDLLMQYADTRNNNLNSYDVNLLEPSTLISLLKHSSDPMLILTTAITLGQVTFIRVRGNTFKLQSDQYNFEMHSWADSKYRNLFTIAGHIVNEGISISIDYLLSDSLGIILGLVRRHGGRTDFWINFSGEMVIE